jgi:hypothetical protein
MSSGHGSDKPRTENHPNRQVHRGRFLPAAPDTHTKTAADAGAYASNNVGYRELSNYAASYSRQGKAMPDWLHKEMGYDD